MRAYFLGNMYLSSIQQGIQALHVLGEMVNKYTLKSRQQDELVDWMTKHKTVILLGGGYGENLVKVHELFRTTDQPCAIFHEEQAALSGAPTSTGIVLPERMYSIIPLFRGVPMAGTPATVMLRQTLEYTMYVPNTAGNIVPQVWTYTQAELNVIEELAKYSLAS